MSSVMDCNELYKRAMVVAFDLHVFVSWVMVRLVKVSRELVLRSVYQSVGGFDSVPSTLTSSDAANIQIFMFVEVQCISIDRPGSYQEHTAQTPPQIASYQYDY